MIARHNPGVHGAVLTEALASRFAVQIQVATDYDLAAGLLVNPRAVRVARNLAARQGQGEVGWAPQLRELLAFQQVQAVLGADAAVQNLIGVAPRRTVTWSPRSSAASSAAATRRSGSAGRCSDAPAPA